MQVAAWAEERAGERAEEMAELLATHLSDAVRYLAELAEGGEDRRRAEHDAFRWARVAGERAMRLWERTEAVRWFRSALDLTAAVNPRAEDLARLWEQLARASEGIAPYAEVATAFEPARAEYEALGRDADVGRAEAWLTWVAFQSGRDRDVEAHAHRALALLQPGGDGPDLVMTLRILGRDERRRGRAAEAVIREGIERTRRWASAGTLAWMEGNLADYLIDQGRLDEAEGLVEGALESARSIGESLRIAYSLGRVRSSE